MFLLNVVLPLNYAYKPAVGSSPGTRPKFMCVLSFQRILMTDVLGVVCFLQHLMNVLKHTKSRPKGFWMVEWISYSLKLFLMGDRQCQGELKEEKGAELGCLVGVLPS